MMPASTYIKTYDVLPQLPKRQKRLEIVEWHLDVCNYQASCAALLSVFVNKTMANLNNRDARPLRVTYEYMTECMMKQHSMYAVKKAFKWLLSVGFLIDCRNDQQRFLKNQKIDNAYYVKLNWHKISDRLLSEGYELPDELKSLSKDEFAVHLSKSTSVYLRHAEPKEKVLTPSSTREKPKKKASKATKPYSVSSVESDRHIRNMLIVSDETIRKETPYPLAGSCPEGCDQPRGIVLSRRRSDKIEVNEDNMSVNNYNLNLLISNKDLYRLIVVAGIVGITSYEARLLMGLWDRGELNSKHLDYFIKHSNPPQFDSAKGLINYFKQSTEARLSGVPIFEDRFADMCAEQNVDPQNWKAELTVQSNA
jgi:hypothetical protein